MGEAVQNLTLSDEEVERFYTYGFAHYGSGSWNEAADVFRLLCTRRPLEPRFWFGLAATLQESGSYREALNSWAMASLLKANDPYPHFHAAECYFSLLMADEAAKALSEAEARVEQTHPLKPKMALLRERWRL
jgi:type III secretion system low calcium response chaperone LcrH/SycD